MDSKTYDLLKRIATECRAGREVAVSGADYDRARYILGKGFARGERDCNLDGSGLVVFDDLLADGVDAIRAWENRRQRYAWDVFLVVLTAILMALASAAMNHLWPVPGPDDRGRNERDAHVADGEARVLEAAVLRVAGPGPEGHVDAGDGERGQDRQRDDRPCRKSD